MALIKGNTGLGKDIYDALNVATFIDNQQGIPAAQKAQTKQDALDKLVKFADKVIDHYVTNMEVKGVTTSVNTSGTLNPAVLVTTTTGAPVLHVPPTGAPVATSGTGTQSNDGTGHVA